MGLSIEFIILILGIHFVADFVLQSHWMAMNKSKSLIALGAHVAVYTGVVGLILGWSYGLCNGLAHLLVDFCTSKATAALWKRGEVHWFFVVIGADQFIHYAILFATWEMF